MVRALQHASTFTFTFNPPPPPPPPRPHSHVRGQARSAPHLLKGPRCPLRAHQADRQWQLWQRPSSQCPHAHSRTHALTHSCTHALTHTQDARPLQLQLQICKHPSSSNKHDRLKTSLPLSLSLVLGGFFFFFFFFFFALNCVCRHASRPMAALLLSR